MFLFPVVAMGCSDRRPDQNWIAGLETKLREKKNERVDEENMVKGAKGKGKKLP